MAYSSERLKSPGLVNGGLFFAFVLVGGLYIVFAKFYGFSAIYVTAVPVVVMVAYAATLVGARLFHLRDDQSGDNLYYMGFLFTLTSLAVSLYQFSSQGAAEQIVQNFGVAIASTIAGIALRILFNQMRRDPVEVEHAARLELAAASRKVRRELDSTVLEFSYFRRAAQQSLADALDEIVSTLSGAKEKFVGQLDDFARASSKPLQDASQKSGETIDGLISDVSSALAQMSKQIAIQTGELSKGSTTMVKSLETVANKLEAMQTPEHIIEIKLNPMIQGLSRAVNTFSKSAEAHAKAVDANLSQTQALVKSMTASIDEVRTLVISREASVKDVVTASAGEGTGGSLKGEIGLRAVD